MAAAGGGRFKELLKKYGKVAVGVHFSVSAVSITGLYIAIKNNVDVESVFEKWHIPHYSIRDDDPETPPKQEVKEVEEVYKLEDDRGNGGGKVVAAEEKKGRNRTAELAASTSGALALAFICNKALVPVRVPITLALTPPIARFLAKRKLIKNSPL